MNLFGFFNPDIVLTNKIAAAFISACSAVTGAFIVKQLTGRWLISLVACCFFSFTCSSFLLGMEFQKNSFGMLFFLMFLSFLLLAEKKMLYYFPAGISLVLSLLAHKLTGMLCMVFICCYLGLLFLFTRQSADRKKWIKRILLFLLIPGLGLILLIILNGFFASPLRLIDISHLLAEFNLSGLGERFKTLLFGRLSIPEKIEYLFYHIQPFLFLPLLIGIVKSTAYSKPVKAFWCTLWLVSLILINPFLKFNWDSIAARLLIISYVPLALFSSHAIALIAEKRLIYKLVSVFLLMLMVLTVPAAVKTFHAGRYPDYRRLYPAFIQLKTEVPRGKKLIAHRGISTFIWYITGIITENFTPTGNYDRYYRVVYGLGAVHFEKYRKTGNYRKPVKIENSPYLLVQEELWQAFYQDKKDTLRFLANPMNPNRIRPPEAYYFNEDLWKEKLKNYSPSIE